MGNFLPNTKESNNLPYYNKVGYNRRAYNYIYKYEKNISAKNLKRIRKFGFRARNKNVGGKKVLKEELQRKKTLTVTDEYQLKRKSLYQRQDSVY
jgi:ribosomal protein L34